MWNIFKQNLAPKSKNQNWNENIFLEPYTESGIFDYKYSSNNWQIAQWQFLLGERKEIIAKMLGGCEPSPSKLASDEQCVFNDSPRVYLRKNN